MSSGRRKQSPRRAGDEKAPARVTFTTEPEMKDWLRLRATNLTIESGEVVTLGDLCALAVKRYHRAVERLEKQKENRDE